MVVSGVNDTGARRFPYRRTEQAGFFDLKQSFQTTVTNALTGTEANQCQSDVSCKRT
jgi:hypothetical protein